MKLFAWTLLFQNTLPKDIPDLDIDIMKISQKWIYAMWGLEEEQSFEDIITILWKHFWEVEYQDISSEDDGDQIEILLEELETWVFETVSFEGNEVSFQSIVERFSETDSVLAVREAETSHKYWNKVIRVDFLY